MKKLSLVVLASVLMFLLSNAVYSQKIKDDDGLITVDGKPYVKLVKKTAILIMNDFWVQNLDGKELVFAELKTRITKKWDKEKKKYIDETSYYYLIHFTESGAEVVVNEQLGKRGLIKILFKNKLIIANEIDPVAEREYILKFGGSIDGIKSTASVVIKEEKIYHYDKLLGTFLTQSTTSEKGMSERAVLVYDNNGEKVVEAIALLENAIEWSVFTYKDEKMTYIKYDSPDEMENLFKWISDKKYFE